MSYRGTRAPRTGFRTWMKMGQPKISPGQSTQPTRLQGQVGEPADAQPNRSEQPGEQFTEPQPTTKAPE